MAHVAHQGISQKGPILSSTRSMEVQTDRCCEVIMCLSWMLGFIFVSKFELEVTYLLFLLHCLFGLDEELDINHIIERSAGV
jgi:hypothetical protein